MFPSSSSSLSQHEVSICRQEQPFEIIPASPEGVLDSNSSPMDVSMIQSQGSVEGSGWPDADAADIAESAEVVETIDTAPSTSDAPMEMSQPVFQAIENESSIGEENEVGTTGGSYNSSKKCM